MTRGIFVSDMKWLYYNYNQHGVKLDEERRYQCDNCHRSYKHQSNLCNHKREECGKEPSYFCPICNKGFKKKQHMQRHMSGVHGMPQTLPLLPPTMPYPNLTFPSILPTANLGHPIAPGRNEFVPRTLPNISQPGSLPAHISSSTSTTYNDGKGIPTDRSFSVIQPQLNLTSTSDSPNVNMDAILQHITNPQLKNDISTLADIFGVKPHNDSSQN